jgi:hypothetical protein
MNTYFSGIQSSSSTSSSSLMTAVCVRPSIVKVVHFVGLVYIGFFKPHSCILQLAPKHATFSVEFGAESCINIVALFSEGLVLSRSMHVCYLDCSKHPTHCNTNHVHLPPHLNNHHGRHEPSSVPTAVVQRQHSFHTAPS